MWRMLCVFSVEREQITFTGRSSELTGAGYRSLAVTGILRCNLWYDVILHRFLKCVGERCCGCHILDAKLFFWWHCVIFFNNSTGEKYRAVAFRWNRNWAKPLQFRNFYKFWERANDVRPYRLFWQVCCAAKSLRSVRIYICSGLGWAVQILCSDITFIIVHTFFCFFSLNLHLVGLRRMRLCLKLRKGLCPLTLQAL